MTCGWAVTNVCPTTLHNVWHLNGEVLDTHAPSYAAALSTSRARFELYSEGPIWHLPSKKESSNLAAFAATLLRGPIDLREMRHSLASWLELTDARADVRDAVLLATHEATANAMAHGQPESPVSISASQGEAGGFTVEVTNLGVWNEPEPGHDGHGLSLMSELMSEVEFELMSGIESETKTRVRMLSG